MDIRINDPKIHRAIGLSVDDDVFILNKTEQQEGFLILKRGLTDYYGEEEVYLNDLPNLLTEIRLFKNLFESEFLPSMKQFIDDFSALVEFAIEQRKTVRFEGD